MPAKHGPIERLDLRFRTEPARPAKSRSWLPGGWLLWFGVGIVVGVTSWIAGQSYLTEQLTSQLGSEQPVTDALLALDGLDLLGNDASLEMVRGLEHPDSRVGRAAYRNLTSQLDAWKNLDIEVRFARMRALAQRLESLNAATPDEHRILASSLAARLYATCLESDDPNLQPVMAICQRVIAHPNSQVAPDSSTQSPVPEAMDMNQSSAKLTPPPPLPTNSDQFTAPAGQGPKDSSADPSSSGIAQREALHRSSSAPLASMRLTASPTRPRSSSSFSDLTPDSVPLHSFTNTEDASLTPVPASESPVLVSSPASISSEPLVRMKIVSNEVNLDGIQNLEIEELVRLLGSIQPRVAQAAALALRAKGLSDEKLELASELATTTAARRMELVQQLAVATNLDPRPWLLWMAEDGEPEVRKLSISLMHSMLDQQVEQSLRILLMREQDTEVQQMLRQVLMAGAHP